MSFLRIALGLHLGVSIVVKHTCGCGSKVDVFGTHGLSCRRSGGCIPWHAVVNETIILFLCLEVYLLFWSLSVCVVRMVSDWMECH